MLRALVERTGVDPERVDDVILGCLEEWGITREEMEEFSIESHERALRARAERRFEHKIVPYGGKTADEGSREPDRDKTRPLPPLLDGGVTTAAMASQISDASAVALPRRQ